MRTYVYVDGFNLYYGGLKGTSYKWLDLEALCRRLLPRDEIVCIRYFTARVDDRNGAEPQQPARQQVYLRALGTLPMVKIHFGQFRTRRKRLPLAEPERGGRRTVEVLTTEEKGSDVNLATNLLVDGFDRSYDSAVVITNDSDLATPICVVRRKLGKSVGVINPHSPYKRSRQLQGTFFKQLRPNALRDSQFADVLKDDNGTFRKPPAW